MMTSRLRCFFCCCAWKVAMLVSREEIQTRGLPPPLNQILRNLHDYDQFSQERCVREEKLDLKSETPLESLLKMYECLLLDQPVELQAEARWFFSHSDWLLKRFLIRLQTSGPLCSPGLCYSSSFQGLSRYPSFPLPVSFSFYPHRRANRGFEEAGECKGCDTRVGTSCSFATPAVLHLLKHSRRRSIWDRPVGTDGSF